MAKVLLIDDEEGIRRVLNIILTQAGYSVLLAKNGKEGLDLFESECPDVVVTDIKMPKIDGIQVLRAVKEKNEDCEVIVITGHGEMDLAIEALKLQASDFINKPISNDAILIAIQRALERVAIRRKLKEYTLSLEERVIRSERMAAMGETVAGMAHAIKNILGGLKGGIFVFEKGLELERQELMMQGWQVVKRNIEKVQELVMDLLNYAGKREPELEQCDPNEVVLDVLELMKDRAEEYAVEIDFERGNFSYHPFLDRKLINRSLANLITNAIDACSEPLTLGRRGRVVVRTQEGPSGEVCFCVSDNGCGMEEDIRRKIFHCFFTTKGSRGTGLGLMLTHKMVLEHGGYMEVDSRAGEGSTFRIILPAIRKPHVQEIKERDESRPEDRGLRFG